MGDPRRPRTQVFRMFTIARGTTRGKLHLHILLGNISVPDLWTSLQSWRGDICLSKHRETGRVEVWDAWGAVHYVLCQDDRLAHRLDELSYCHNLLVWERSPSLTYWEGLLAEDARVRKVLSQTRRRQRPSRPPRPRVRREAGPTIWEFQDSPESRQRVLDWFNESESA
jgi:hypothetical protein